MASTPAPADPPVLAATGLTGGYRGVAAVESVDLTVGAGEVVGVVGPSGCGKTTLLRLLCGQGERYAGSITVAGTPVRPRRPPRRVGYVPQVGTVDWDFPLSVEQAVLLGLTADGRWRPWFTRAERARVGELLDWLGLDGLAHRSIRELSGGQQQRLFLARALVRDADLLLLDEPTSGVDVATRADILRLVGELAANGLSVVLTTHDLNWVAAHLPRIVCLQSSVIADGPPSEVLTPEVLRKTYGADLAVLRDGEQLVVTDDRPLLGHAPGGGGSAPAPSGPPPWTG